MAKLKQLINKIPKIWLVPIGLLLLITLIAYENERQWQDLLKLAYVLANDYEYFESLLLIILAVPAGYYVGIVQRFFRRQKMLQFEINHQYATHILKRLILDIDDVDRNHLRSYKRIEDVPIDILEHVHQEISNAIDLFYYDSRRLQRSSQEPLKFEELEAIMHADRELFDKSPIRNICIQNVFDTIRLLNKR